MSDSGLEGKRLKMVTERRKSVSLAQENLVRIRPIAEGRDLPRLVEPAIPGVDLKAWAGGSRELIGRELAEHGGLLFRGFSLRTPEEFEEVVRAISGDLLEYRERSSPRDLVSGRIYTSTDYPPDQPIFLHNENSYQATWPQYIFFFCHSEPEEGGETPIADTRKVYQRIDPRVRERFDRQGCMYVRNFSEFFGLPWQTVFQTEDQTAVEAYCQKNGISCEWRGDSLRTRAVRPTSVRHPRTGETVWFNHATFFHVSTLPPLVREGLLAELEEWELPANTYYGDGGSIEPETLEHLRAAYRAETLLFPWQQGDLLMLDNMLVSHGRSAFRGARKILVAMTDPVSWESFGGAG